MTTERKDLKTYHYQQTRAAFLSDKTCCHWCGASHRKLTIDHVIPVALMVDRGSLAPLDVRNWVAACTSCNARRGAMITNARRGKVRRGRSAAGFSRSAAGFSRSVPPSRDW